MGGNGQWNSQGAFDLENDIRPARINFLQASIITMIRVIEMTIITCQPDHFVDLLVCQPVSLSDLSLL